MNENNIQQQIDEMNGKLDLLLHHVSEQRAKSETVEDLISDLSIIGKDVYDSTVEELDNRQVEIDPAELTELGISFLRNIKNVISMMDTFESMVDLTKEVGPIANEVIIDISKKLGEFEEKGYFNFFRDAVLVMEKIIQTDIMKSANNVVSVYSSLQNEEIPNYSMWQIVKEMKSPEMRKSMGFMITFMKELSQTNTIK